MPRLVSKNPAYRRHKPSGQAVVTLNGRDIYLGPYGSQASRREYDRLVGEWLAGGRQPCAVAADSGQTILEVMNAFRVHVTRYYRHPDGTPTKEVEGFRNALRPLRELYGRTPAAAFGPLALRSLQQRMVRLGWSRPYVNKQIGRVKQMFKWAVGQELVPAGVLHGLQAVEGLKYGRTDARETRPVEPVAQDVVEQTLQHTTPTVAAMVRVQVLTGMRPGEVCSLRGAELDTMGAIWVYRPRRHKMAYKGLKRQVLIGPKAREILRPYLQADLEAPLFSPVRSEQERLAARHAARQTPLSCGNVPGSHRTGRRNRSLKDCYTTARYDQAIRHACERAWPLPDPLRREPGETDARWRSRLGARGWEQVKAWRREHRWTANRLRHTAATQLRRDFGLDVAQTVLGHRLGSTVTELYAESSMSKATEAIQRVG